MIITTILDMRRSFVGFAALLLLFGVSAATAGPFAWIHEWQSNQSVEAARAALAQNDFSKAVLALQRALQLNGNNRHALEMMADLSARRSPADEVPWRLQILQLNPNDLDARAAYCLAAIRAESLERAQEAFDQWPPDERHTSPYFRVAGQVALANNSFSEAMDDFRQALRLPGATASDRLNLASVEIFSQNPFERGEALSALDELSRNPETEAGASRTLIRRALYVVDLDEAKTRTDELLAKAFTKENIILACSVYVQLPGQILPDLIRRAIEAFKAEPLFQSELLDWLNLHDRASLALACSDSLSGEAAKNPYIKCARAGALERLGKWSELFDAVDNDSWNELDGFRLAYKIRAETMWAGHYSTERDVVWKQVLGLANQHLRMLWALAGLTSRWSWQPQFEEALWAVAAVPDGAGLALQRLDQIYRPRNDTAGLFRVAKRTLELRPKDQHAANEYVRTGFLLNVDRGTFAEFAREQWEVNQNRSPRMTALYAYALSLEGKLDDAARVLQTLSESERQNEALYSGLVRAACGDRTGALDYLRLAKRLPLLPEEETLLERALAG